MSNQQESYENYVRGQLREQPHISLNEMNKTLEKEIKFLTKMNTIEKLLSVLAIVNLMLYFFNDTYNQDFKWVNGAIGGAVFMKAYVSYVFNKYFN